ncbi:MAG: calycin-like domain-containing protein [Sodaliphilus sp.]
MRKLFAFVASVACAFSAMATNYQGELTVTVNDETAVQGTEITVTKADGLYDLSIKNFKLVSGETVLPVGNIELKGCQGTDAYGITTIKFNSNVTVAPGDDPNVASEDWLGPMLGEVPIEMTAKLNDQVLSVNIDINLTLLQQIIQVGFVGNTPAPLEGDLTKDGVVNVSDVTALVNKVLE